MRAGADQPSAVDDDHLVGLGGGRNPLGDNDDGGFLRYLLEGGAHPRVGVHVEGAEGVVEQIDGGAADDRPGDGESLPLPAGKVDAALGHPHLQPVWVRAHEPVGVGHPQRFPHLVAGDVVPRGGAVTQVVGDRSGKEVAALGTRPIADHSSSVW